MEVGDEFCGSQSEELQKSVRLQSEKYFGKYHHGCLEELRIFLENESWTHCPVKNDFSCLQLQVKSIVMKVRLLSSYSNCLSSILSTLPLLLNFRNFVLYEEPFKMFIFMSSNRLSKVQTVAINLKIVVLLLVVSFHGLHSLGLHLTLLLVIYKKKTFLQTLGWRLFVPSTFTWKFRVNLLKLILIFQDDLSGYYSDESDEDVPDELRGDFVDDTHAENLTNPRFVKHCIFIP